MASQIFEILRKPGYNYLTQVSIIFLWLFSILTWKLMTVAGEILIMYDFFYTDRKYYIFFDMYRMTSSLSLKNSWQLTLA